MQTTQINLGDYLIGTTAAKPAKPAKPSQYETIMQIASSVQEAGGSVSHLHKITLEDFLSICEKNSIEITVNYNKGK